jgi:hypothetical protein
MNIKKNQRNKQIGGDGYSPNLDQPIGGNPGFMRYSNNNKPIFDGDLLNGALNMTLDNEINSNSEYNILTGGGMRLKKTKSKDCGCSTKKSIYDLIKLEGGSSNEKKITQFDAIREVAYDLSPLKTSDLTKLNVTLFNNILLRKNEKKAIQFGGFVSGLEDIIAPLGKNNLLVLAALLLLHHFAVERRFNKQPLDNKLKGGNPFLSSITEILSPIGLNQFGAPVIFDGLREAFTEIKENKISTKSTKQKGGNNPLRQLIEPLGSEAFLAVGLLIIMERFFTSRVNNMKKTKDMEKDKKKKDTLLKGGRTNLYYDKLFNLLAPITFNAFATEDFLKKMSNFKK